MTVQFETRIRDNRIEGIDERIEWVWPVQDEGAWLGPSQEFMAIYQAMRPKIRNHGTIVQAGGCCGMYPKLFSRYFERVITFEPAPLNWFCLTQNCTEPNIIAYNAAIGEFDQNILLSIASYSNVGTNTVSQVEHAGTIEVQQMRIDSLNLDACDAIQLDIEGYEISALMGAVETISKFRPVISLETRNQNDPSHQFLYSLGYQVHATTTNDTQFFSPI